MAMMTCLLLFATFVQSAGTLTCPTGISLGATQLVEQTGAKICAPAATTTAAPTTTVAGTTAVAAATTTTTTVAAAATTTTTVAAATTTITTVAAATTTVASTTTAAAQATTTAASTTTVAAATTTAAAATTTVAGTTTAAPSVACGGGIDSAYGATADSGCSSVAAGATCNATLPAGTAGRINKCLKAGKVTFFCPLGNTDTSAKVLLSNSNMIECKVCALPAFTDTDSKKGKFGGTLTWGPNQIAGVVDESMILGYKSYFVNDCGLKFSSPAITKSKATTAHECCLDTAYSHDVKEADVPDGATHIVVVPFGMDALGNTLELTGGVTVAFTDKNPSNIGTLSGAFRVGVAATTLLSAAVTMVF